MTENFKKYREFVAKEFELLNIVVEKQGSLVEFGEEKLADYKLALRIPR
jgi:hypothetical protein